MEVYHTCSLNIETCDNIVINIGHIHWEMVADTEWLNRVAL